MKKISYELTPFRVFCPCFFCTRGSRSFDGCSICSRTFVNNNYVAKKKTDSAFIITRNSIRNLDLFLLMKYLNTQCAVLNIYYMIGNYVHRTENFNEVFCEIANDSFDVYVLFLQNYLRMFFNLLKLITEVAIENCLRNKSPSNCYVNRFRKNHENILFSLYCNTGKMLVNYLNGVISSQPFKHIFFAFRAGIDYNENTLRILKLK